MGERELTMVNTNIAPQWQRFNGGNWAVLEGAVRTYAATMKRKLFVFTGTGKIPKGHGSFQKTIDCDIFGAKVQ